MNNPLFLEFKDVAGRSISLTLVSKFTCINGKDSGEGKTEMLDVLEQGIVTGEIECNLGENFAIANGGSIDALLASEHRLVIMSDESTLLRQDLIHKINKSKHLFVCITRSMLLHMDYSLYGIYEVYRVNDWFDCRLVKSLPLVQNSGQIENASVIITESREGRSEYELLQNYFKKLKAAGGRDKIERVLRGCQNAVVFADLSNIGRAYRILQKRCINNNNNIKFYPYQCFEQLLFDSKLVQSLPGAAMMRHDLIGEKLFDYKTIEQYYECILEQITAGTDIAYEHGKALPVKFMDADNALNSNTGELLRLAIHSQSHGKKSNSF